MIINEKQIQELIQIAQVLMSLALDKNESHWDDLAKGISRLLDAITNQQSQELKVIE